MGLFDRILERFRSEPTRQDAPGLFTARSPGVSTDRDGTTGAPPPEEDLWDRPDASPAPQVIEPVEPDVTEPVVIEPGVLEPEVADVAEPVDPEAELAAIEELAPPADEPETPVGPVWDEDAWDDAGPVEDAPVEDAVAPAGSTADGPLFGSYGTAPEPPEPEGPAPEPVPPLFDPPEVATEPEPEDLAPGATAAPDPQPPSEPGPRGLVVETHPEAFDPTPAQAAAPAEDVPPAQAAEAEPVPAEPGPGTGTGDEPTAADGRTVRVHDERLDKRPGPIRMTPSEAIRLAQDGPRATRRPDPPET